MRSRALGLLVLSGCLPAEIEVPPPPWDEGLGATLTLLETEQGPIGLEGTTGARLALPAGPHAMIALGWSCPSLPDLGVEITSSGVEAKDPIRVPDQALSLAVEAGEAASWAPVSSLSEVEAAWPGARLQSETPCRTFEVDDVPPPTVDLEEIPMAVALSDEEVLMGGPLTGLLTVGPSGAPTPFIAEGLPEGFEVTGGWRGGGRLWLLGLDGSLLSRRDGAPRFEPHPAHPALIDCEPEAEEARDVLVRGDPEGREIFVAADDGGVARFDVAADAWTIITPPEAEAGAECPHGNADLAWIGPGQALALHESRRELLFVDVAAEPSVTEERVPSNDIIESLSRVEGRGVFVGMKFGELYRRDGPGRYVLELSQTMYFDGSLHDVQPFEDGLLLLVSQSFRLFFPDGYGACATPALESRGWATHIVPQRYGYFVVPNFSPGQRRPMLRLAVNEIDRCQAFLP